MNKLNINELRAYCNNNLGISCRENGKLLDRQSLLRKIKQSQRGGAEVHYWLADFTGPAMLPHDVDDENYDENTPFIDPALDAEMVAILSNYDLPDGKIIEIYDYEITAEDEQNHPIVCSFAVNTDPESENGMLTFSISIDVTTGDLTVNGYLNGDVDTASWPDNIIQQLQGAFRTFIRHS